MIKAKKTLEKIEAYSIDRYYPKYDLKLDSNENVYGPSEAVIQAIRNFEPSKINHYPAYGNLVDKLSELVGADSSCFLLTNGCDEAINVVLNTYLEENDTLLAYSPTFSMPKIYCDVIGAKFFEIPYKEKWRFDYELYLENITNETKILYITSPNNPTGEIVSVDDVKKLAQKFSNKLILLDCTYFNYSEIFHNEYYNLVKEFGNVAIVKSFSKDYALAGLRIGYIFANENIISEIKKVISPYSVNAVAVQAAYAALLDVDYFSSIRKKINTSKKLIVDGLNNLGFKAYNTEANFVLCDAGFYADFIYNKLLSNGVKVKYFKGCDALNNTLRITACKLEDVDRLLSFFAPRPLFVFDLDGVVFDVKNSYRLAIKKTFEHFVGRECSDNDIQSVKNLGGMSNDWDLTEHLIKQAGIDVEYDEIVKVFQNLFFKPDRIGSKGLIDNEENVLCENFFRELNKYADCAVFTGRPKDEAFHSLERFKIKQYFSYFICNEDVDGNHKPSPFGLNKIMKNCKYSEIYYFGDTVDDIKAGKDASVKVFGVIPPNASNVDETKAKLFEFGANGVIDDKEQILALVKKVAYANN